MKTLTLGASLAAAALAAACAGSDAAGARAGSSGAGGTSAGASGSGGSVLDAGTAGMGGATADAAPADSDAGDAGDPVFIAFSEDFADFQSWTSFYLGDLPPTINEIPGPRTVYIKQLPPKGSQSFPVGTMIVKAIQVGDPVDWQIFAMVKRGGGFNDTGAVGWEWFELSLKLGALNVVWRGNAPPNGMGYGGGIGGGVCNTCHASATANDFVQSAPLQLNTL